VPEVPAQSFRVVAPPGRTLDAGHDPVSHLEGDRLRVGQEAKQGAGRHADHPRCPLAAVALEGVEDGRAVGAALSAETDDAKAAGTALRLISEADPPVQASVEVSGDLSADAVNQMSYSQLLAVAENLGIDLTRPDQGAIEGAIAEHLASQLAQPGDPEAE